MNPTPWRAILLASGTAMIVDKDGKHIADLVSQDNAQAIVDAVNDDTITKLDEQLSRVLHEMAGAVSLCWIPKPTGEFDSGLAIEFVSKAIEELRNIIRSKPE